MSESKHTPGPWTYYLWSGTSSFSEFEGLPSSIAQHEEGDESASTIEIAEFPPEHCDLPREEQLANARLIAAAPDLLGALEAAKQFIENGIEFGYISMPDDACPDSAKEVPGMVRAAIAKARGEA